MVSKGPGGGGECAEQKPKTLENISDANEPKVPVIPEPTYQTKPFRSIEQKMFVDSGIRDFLIYSGKGLYGTVASMFRVPTAIRKIANYQTFVSREEIKLFDDPNRKDGATTIGGLVGSFVNAGVIYYSINEATKGNYLPLEILGLSNALFGTFELGRWKTSKKEYSEIKAQEKKDQDEVEAYKEKSIREAPVEEKVVEKTN